MKKKQVICMKWGTLYDSSYVNHLYNMVRANTTGELRFVCLTDDTHGINEHVECHPCPTIDLPAEKKNKGWRKLTTFSESNDLFGFTEDWLFLDLDVVISGDMDPFFDYEPEKSFIVMKNWTQPNKMIGNTSCYRFRVGSHTYLLENLIQSPEKYLSNYRISQQYVSRCISDLNFWPDEWCVLFKVQCIPAWPSRFWKEPIIPDGARVIAFPGVPNPHQALIGEWPVKKPYKAIYKHIKPTSWIGDIWAESERVTSEKISTMKNFS